MRAGRRAQPSLRRRPLGNTVERHARGGDDSAWTRRAARRTSPPQPDAGPRGLHDERRNPGHDPRPDPSRPQCRRSSAGPGGRARPGGAAQDLRPDRGERAALPRAGAARRGRASPGDRGLGAQSGEEQVGAPLQGADASRTGHPKPSLQRSSRRRQPRTRSTPSGRSTTWSSSSTASNTTAPAATASAMPPATPTSSWWAAG